MYAEVTVVVDGAVEEEATFHDETLLTNYIAEIEDEAEGHGYPTDVFVMYHDHDVADECECAQYADDHHPTYSFNAENEVL